MIPPVSTTPVFSMPAIGPPPSGTTPSAWYATVAAATTVTATGVAHDGLEISISNPAYAGLLAMAGGLVSYIPPGSALPTADAAASPGGGSVVLQTGPLDAATLKGTLPPGVVPMTAVLYLDVQPATVKTALAPLVDKLPDPWLQANWDQSFTTTDHKVLAARYLERLMLGQVSVFAPGGTEIGQAALAAQGGPARFTLRLLDGAGNDLSGVLHLRTMAAWAGAAWSGHPLVAAVSNVTVPVNLWVAFEVWKDTTVFERLPAGVDVDLVDYDAIGPNDVRATVKTDASGVAHFSFPSMADLSHDNDLFFLAHTDRRVVASKLLADEWSTKGWTATDGTPGYYPSFAGAQLGDQTHPVVFRVGLDFHGRLEYEDLSMGPGTFVPAPKGIPVSLQWGSGTPGTSKAELRTDDKGEIHLIVFEIDGGDHVYLHVDFEIEDLSVNLPRARVQMLQAGWSSFWNDADRLDYPDNDRTSLGEYTNPQRFRCTTQDRNVALFFLKTLREISVFLFHVTGGSWKGVQDLTYFRTSLSGTAYSWPVGEVNLPPSDHWDRATIVHETAHQVMWQEVNFSSLGIGYQAIFGNLGLYHQVNLLRNAEHALIEGWAEFLEQLFGPLNPLYYPGAPPWPVSTLHPSGAALSSVRNQGEGVEGAFANGLWDLVTKHVDTTTTGVPQSVNGDVTTTASWILDAAKQAKFQAIIWKPFQDLRPLSTPTTTAMLANIGTGNSADWHRLRPELQRWNMAMAAPTVTRIAPITGPVAGGTPVTVTGTEFVVGATVRIGGNPAGSVTATSSTSISAVTPPGAAGAADVVVTEPGGTATLAGAFTYT
jgi:hypothetical protein